MSAGTSVPSWSEVASVRSVGSTGGSFGIGPFRRRRSDTAGWGESTFHSMPIAAYWATRDGVILESNEAFRSLVGDRDLVGENLAALFGDHYSHVLITNLRPDTRLGGDIVAVHTHDGRTRHARHHAWLTPGADRIEGVLEDVTEQVALQGELDEAVERFRHAFGQGPVAMAMADPDNGKFVAVNEAMCRFLGYSEGELLGLGIADVTHPDHVEHDLGQFTRLARGELDVFETEKRYVRADGSSVWGLLSVSMINDPAGRPIYSLARVLDITDRKVAETEAHFRATVLQHVESAVIATDMDNVVTYWNPAAERLFGWSAGEALGTSIFDLVVPDEEEASFAGVMTALAETGMWQGEYVYRRREGTTFPAHVATRLIPGPNGDPAGWVGIAHDLTVRKEIEAHLTDLAAAKDEFIASISHELRTPLTAVMGFASLLRESMAVAGHAGEDGEMIEAILREATDLANIVDDLLLAGRSQLGRLDVDRSVVEIRSEIDRVQDSLGTSYPVTGDELVVVGDPMRVRQIVRNLITNALRYGGKSIAITVGRDRDQGVMVVADDGPGVAPGDTSRLFEPYWRERRHGQGDFVGVGLGLPISRMLAEAMDGTLEYERRGEWTLFELRLPLADAEA
jgi:PAS domain S-box-containing protein